MKTLRIIIINLVLIILISSFLLTPQINTFTNIIIDSSMSREEALKNVSKLCPRSIIDNQVLINVKYYSFDGKIHIGQVVIDKRLADDIKLIFDLAFKIKFPVKSVIPISHEKYFKNGAWDDDLSMLDNNTSAFNYRNIPGTNKISNHSYGFAIDINPFLNPYIVGNKIMPAGSKYDPKVNGTLTKNHPIVEEFIKLGWTWGGNWKSVKDYQHFEKILK